MSAPLQLHDIAGSLAAPPFGQVCEIGLRLVALDFFHRLLVEFQPEDKILDGRDTGIDDADLAGFGHPIQNCDHAVRDRAEPLLPTAYEFCGFRHLAPQPNPAMCGIEQRTSRKSGSTPKAEISRDVFAHPTQNSRALTRANGDAGTQPSPTAPTPASLTLSTPVRGPVGTACASAQAFYSAVCA